MLTDETQAVLCLMLTCTIGLAVWLWHRFKSETFKLNKQSYCLKLPQNWKRMHLSQSVLVCLCLSPSRCVCVSVLCACAPVCLSLSLFCFIVNVMQVAGWLHIIFLVY